MKDSLKRDIFEYILITISSIIYALGTVCFIFPNGLLLGGTSGISVILNSFLPFSAGTILVIINVILLVLAFFVLGKDMAVKTLIGSSLTTFFIWCVEKIILLDNPLIKNNFISAIIGAVIIAMASGIMFYVDSSSGGTDIVALIVRKYSKINIGKALLITDVLIVIVGGILSGLNIMLSSFLGLLFKTFGIDFVIYLIVKFIKKPKPQEGQRNAF
jgi:uncharacterized membrane-anchored protein YitT (DUF2179 family)